jgi:transposase
MWLNEATLDTSHKITFEPPDLARPGAAIKMNASLRIFTSFMTWRLLPHDLPPWQTVYYYLRRWQREGVWDRVHHALVMADRERAGREASPSAAILDSQSVKTADQKGDQRVTTRARRLKVASVTS